MWSWSAGVSVILCLSLVQEQALVEARRGGSHAGHHHHHIGHSHHGHHHFHHWRGIGGSRSFHSFGSSSIPSSSSSSSYGGSSYGGGGVLGLLDLLGGALFGYRQPTYNSQSYYSNQQPYYYRQSTGCEVQQYYGMVGMQQQYYCVCNGVATYQYGGCTSYGYG